MAEVGRVIEEGGYELGALGDGSGIPGFYQRLGWETWQGPTWVAGPDGPERTAEEDGSILVLRTPATGELDPGGPSPATGGRATSGSVSLSTTRKRTDQQRLEGRACVSPCS